MANRRAISAVTLVVLAILLVGGAFAGWRILTKPLPGDDEPRRASGPKCDDGVARGDVVTPADVTVSVYNAGSRSGLADQTQSELEARDFIAGDVGNAPEELESVQFVRVLAPTRTDPAARLVALQFGANTVVEAVKDDLGPGVEVIVGDNFQGLVDAPDKLKARSASSGC
jgi:hypothetical protein